MRRVVSAVILAITVGFSQACSKSTEPNDPPTSGPVLGTWVATPPSSFRLSSMSVTFALNANQTIGGKWSGRRTGCTGVVCADSGLVITFSADDGQVHFQVTAVNAAYSILYDGVQTGATMSGSARVHENGLDASPVTLTFTKQ